MALKDFCNLPQLLHVVADFIWSQRTRWARKIWVIRNHFYVPSYCLSALIIASASKGVNLYSCPCPKNPLWKGCPNQLSSSSSRSRNAAYCPVLASCLRALQDFEQKRAHPRLTSAVRAVKAVPQQAQLLLVMLAIRCTAWCQHCQRMLDWHQI